MPSGTHSESTAHNSQPFRFKTEEFNKFFDFLPPEKRASAHNFFTKDSSGKWMGANPSQINEFVNTHFDPNERMTFHRRMEDYRPSVSKPATSGTRPQPQGPTPEPPPHGFGFTPEPEFAHVPGFTPTHAAERPNQPKKTEEHAHAKPANPGGPDATPEPEKSKGMSRTKKVVLSVVGVIGGTWLLTKIFGSSNHDSNGPGPGYGGGYGGGSY